MLKQLACITGLGLLLTAGVAEASHFRYGHLVWRTVSANAVTSRYVASFQLYNAFRRTGYNGTAPDGYPQIGDIISEHVGGTSLNFGDGDSTGQLRYYVLNIDPAADWIYAVALPPGSNDPNTGIQHTYTSPGPFTANIDTCCRIGSVRNASNFSYRVETIVAFNKTAFAPTSTLPIIVQCPANQFCNFPVPASDPENQILHYRLANNNESYVPPLNGLTINSATGLATYQTPNDVGGLYTAQVVIEKRNQTNPADLLTKTSVDFLIRVVQTLAQGQAPSFQNPTPTCGQQITVQPGQPLQFTVSARTNNPGGTVTLNVIGQPPGSTFSPVLPASGSPAVNSTFAYTPTTAQAGTYQLNFTAVEGGQQTTCGYSIVVPAPNTVVSLSGVRGGGLVRLQTKVAGTLCGTPTYTLFRRVGGTGSFAPVASGPSTLFQTALTGPSATLNEFYVQMSFASNCAAASQSNTLSFVF